MDLEMLDLKGLFSWYKKLALWKQLLAFVPALFVCLVIGIYVWFRWMSQRQVINPTERADVRRDVEIKKRESAETQAQRDLDQRIGALKTTWVEAADDETKQVESTVKDLEASPEDLVDAMHRVNRGEKL